jgi:hypothetical protein
MLVLAFARRDGVEVHTGKLMLLGLWAAPAIVVLAALALALSFTLVR